MKKLSFKTIALCILIIAVACTVSIQSVSALSPEGESMLSQLVSAGSTLGFDIGDLIKTTATSSTVHTTGTSADAETALEKILGQIDIKANILKITDLVNFLNKGGTFEDWIVSNYGDYVEIPESVKNMSEKDIVLYLMGTIIMPDTQNG